MTNVLSFELEKAANWRARKAERYPEDWRNAKAVEALRPLSAAKSEDVDLVGKYVSLCEDANSEICEAVHSDTLRDIGFGFDALTVDEVIQRIVNQLSDWAKRRSQPAVDAPSLSTGGRVFNDGRRTGRGARRGGRPHPAAFRAERGPAASRLESSDADILASWGIDVI